MGSITCGADHFESVVFRSPMRPLRTLLILNVIATTLLGCGMRPSHAKIGDMMFTLLKNESAYRIVGERCMPIAYGVGVQALQLSIPRARAMELQKAGFLQVQGTAGPDSDPVVVFTSAATPFLTTNGAYPEVITGTLERVKVTDVRNVNATFSTIEGILIYKPTPLGELAVGPGEITKTVTAGLEKHEDGWRVTSVSSN